MTDTEMQNAPQLVQELTEQKLNTRGMLRLADMYKDERDGEKSRYYGELTHRAYLAREVLNLTARLEAFETALRLWHNSANDV